MVGPYTRKGSQTRHGMSIKSFLFKCQHCLALEKKRLHGHAFSCPGPGALQGVSDRTLAGGSEGRDEARTSEHDRSKERDQAQPKGDKEQDQAHQEDRWRQAQDRTATQTRAGTRTKGTSPNRGKGPSGQGVGPGRGRRQQGTHQAKQDKPNRATTAPG